MGSSADDQSSSPVAVECEQTESPFNIYNTEVVRLDATNATQMANGDLIKRPDDDSNDGHYQEDQFALLRADYELAEKHLVQMDSVNVRSSCRRVSQLRSASPSPTRFSLTSNLHLQQTTLGQQNKSFTDVTFIVGPPQHSKKYVGHRVLLAMTSPVFETMFYGDMADKSKYIRIADVAPIGFENLLRYAYTDSLNLNSVEDAMLTAYAAKKYLLPQLLRECLTYIEHNIGPSTACVVFEFAHVLNSQQLVLQAMNLIDRQTMAVITNKSFAHVQSSTIEFVANRKYLNINREYALFNAVVNWAHAEARRRSLDQDDWTAVRLILSESTILGAIKFLAMSQEEFARAVLKTSASVECVGASSAESAGPSLAANESSSQEAAELADPASQQTATGDNNKPALQFKLNPNDSNSLLNEREQRAVLLNLILGDVAALPPTISSACEPRQAPPEYFTLKRFRSASNLTISTTTTRTLKSIGSKFQCLSENVFIVGLTIPIRLDASSYANRTPKFECHLKFTTRTTSSSIGGGGQQGSAGASSQLVNELAASVQQQDSSGLPNGATLLMDTIDESLHISIARDKECLVRLKRPILVRMGNINELTLTFQTYALDEDIVALRTPKLRSANFSEQTDGENISWLFFKTPGVEFSELHYYY